jgi:hypothetical protein
MLEILSLIITGKRSEAFMAAKFNEIFSGYQPGQ